MLFLILVLVKCVCSGCHYLFCFVLLLFFYQFLCIWQVFFLFCFSFSFYIEIVFLIFSVCFGARPPGFPLSLLNLLFENLRDDALLRSFVSVSHSAVLCLPYKSTVAAAPTYETLSNSSRSPLHLGICHWWLWVLICAPPPLEWLMSSSINTTRRLLCSAVTSRFSSSRPTWRSIWQDQPRAQRALSSHADWTTQIVSAIAPLRTHSCVWASNMTLHADKGENLRWISHWPGDRTWWPDLTWLSQSRGCGHYTA